MTHTGGDQEYFCKSVVCGRGSAIQCPSIIEGRGPETRINAQIVKDRDGGQTMSHPNVKNTVWIINPLSTHSPHFHHHHHNQVQIQEKSKVKAVSREIQWQIQIPLISSNK